MASENTPDTLLGAIVYFADVDVATAFVTSLRWPDGVRCPHCESVDTPYVKSRRVWQCKNCRKQFSVKVGSIFEDSPIPLSKWLPAMWMLVNCKNGVSSYDIARDLRVTQKTAWFMLHRLRLAIQSKSFDKMKGDVELDETFIGGKARNMHHRKRQRLGITQGKSMAGKVAVLGLLERHGEKGSQIHLASIPSNTNVLISPCHNCHGAERSADEGDHSRQYADGTISKLHQEDCSSIEGRDPRQETVENQTTSWAQ